MKWYSVQIQPEKVQELLRKYDIVTDSLIITRFGRDYNPFLLVTFKGHKLPEED